MDKVRSNYSSSHSKCDGLANSLRAAHIQLCSLKSIRRLTYCVPFRQAAVIGPKLICGVLSTIKSQVFYEFVLELKGLSRDSKILPLVLGHWEETDRFIEERFVRWDRNFKFIVRTGAYDYLQSFREHVKGVFPALTYRGCIHFEMSHSVDKRGG